MCRRRYSAPHPHPHPHPVPINKAGGTNGTGGTNAANSADSISVRLVQEPNATDSGLIVVGVPRGKHSFSFAVPKEIYVDESKTTLSQSGVTREDGSPLPSWLKFDQVTMKFVISDTPDNGLPIRVVLHIGGVNTTILINWL